MFERILVPYDGGQSARLALEQALLIAKAHGAVLHGLHVFDPAPYLSEPLLSDVGMGLPQPLDPNLSMVSQLLKEAEQRARETLAGLEQRCQAAGVRAVTRLLEGDVGRTVLEQAHQADLLVLARSPQHPDLGALSDAWVRRSPIPVCLSAGAAVAPQAVLLAFDGGVRSADALQVAARLAQQWKLPMELLVVREDGRVDQETLDQAQGLLHELGLEPTSARLLEGHPAEVLSAQTRPEALLVMGTHGHGQFLGLRFGHTVDGVVQGAKGPLLICP